jgi:hypothetical protein
MFGQRQRMTKSGAAASSLPRCKYFEQMKFLHEKTSNQATESNLTYSQNSVQQVTPSPSATISIPNPSHSTCSSTTTTKRKASEMSIPPTSSRHGFQKSRQDAIDMAILKQLETTDKFIDGNKSLANEETDDEVSHYCKSLIPVISALALRKKRLAMIKIRQLLFDIEFED